MSIYDNIRVIAKPKKITISQIERDNGFCRGMLAKWNTVEPSAVKLKKVADYLNVSMEELLKGEE